MKTGYLLIVKNQKVLDRQFVSGIDNLNNFSYDNDIRILIGTH